MKKNKFVRIGLLLVVLALFVWYFLSNQAQFERIGNLNALQVLGIIFGQSVVVISNILIVVLFVKFVNKHIKLSDAARVTAYSSLVNFFGFLQGGVGLRAVYLKTRFDISIKRYFILTVAQYLILFSVAALIIITGLYLVLKIDWIILAAITVSFILLASILSLEYLKPDFYTSITKKIRGMSIVFQLQPLLGLLFASILQLSGAMLANFIELSAIGSNVSFGGLLVYTGVAQFSILVALTPGAIGIREGLLLLVQNQMHLTTQDIVVAATIDRVIYFITLAIFTPLALSAKKKKMTKEQ